MCYSAPQSLFAFCLILGIALCLWNRNLKYDRVLSPFLFVVSMVQLVEFGVHTQKVSSQLAGQLLFLILWMQPVVFCFACYLFLDKERSPYAAAALVLGIFYSVVLVHSFREATTECFSVKKGPSGHLEWSQGPGQGGQGIFGDSVMEGSTYLAGIFLPLLLLEFDFGWLNLGLHTILLTGGTTFVFIREKFPGLQFSSLWCYSAILVALSAWVAPVI